MMYMCERISFSETSLHASLTEPSLRGRSRGRASPGIDKPHLSNIFGVATASGPSTAV